MKLKEINSLANPVIKQIKSLKLKKYSKQHNLFLAEGYEYITKAIKNGYTIKYLLFSQASDAELNAIIGSCEFLIKTTNAVLKELSQKNNPQPFLAAININKKENQDTILPTSFDTAIALDNIRDAGNLGTIIRTCEAVGVKDIILIGDSVYPFSLDIVRASAGSIFTVNIYNVTQDKFINLMKQSYSIATGFKDSVDFRDIDYTKANKIIIMGNESNGISSEIIQHSDIIAQIPQQKGSNSLNLSIASALMLYEAKKYIL